ncbi:MAG TPA: hypothetical protein PLH56_00970 [Candidatus Omnitrophota bacterium]|nr:hypothetical protein [Candidatus Omnitrophota bacterium]
MVAQNKETAEQKLLKMIEISSDKANVAGLKSGQASVFNFNATSFLKVSNKFLILAVIVTGVVFLNEVRSGADFSEKNFYVSEAQGSSQSGAGAVRQNIVVPEISFYLAAMKDRNIFTAFEKGHIKQVVDASAQSRRIAQKTKGFRLVGVSWLDNVETASVMLENVEQKKTYFLQKGEKVGDIIVKTIYADSVALGYENEEIIIGYDKTQK